MISTKQAFKVVALTGIIVGAALLGYENYKLKQTHKEVLAYLVQQDEEKPVLSKELATGNIWVKKTQYDPQWYVFPKVCSPEGAF